MVSPLNAVLLVVVAPLVLVLPGYLVLAILRARDPQTSLAEPGVETIGLAATVSLALLVLLGFALTQTVGLSRLSLAASLGLLLAGLGLLARRHDVPGLRSPEGPRADRASEPPTPGGGEDFDVSGPTVLVGAVVLTVALGGFLYDGTQPYSEAYYANASEVETNLTVAPGEQLAWTIVVDNRERQPTSYAIDTVLVPADQAGQPDTDQRSVDEASLPVEEDGLARYEIRFTAPEEGVWKVQTTVQPDGGEPLTLHRWIAVETDQPSSGSSGRQTTPSNAR